MRPIDTNVLVRFVTGDPSDQAERAGALLRDAEPGSLLLLDVILAETVAVLRRIYGAPREQIATVVAALMATRTIHLDNGAVLRRTLDLYSGRRMDWPDAYLVATAEDRGLRTVVSYDKFDARIRDLGVYREEP